MVVTTIANAPLQGLASFFALPTLKGPIIVMLNTASSSPSVQPAGCRGFASLVRIRQGWRSHRLNVLKFAVVLLSGWVLAGCAVMQQFVQAPDISVSNMKLARAGLLEQVLEFQLELDNPNAFALPLVAMNYTLELAGIEIGQGEQTKSVTLPAKGQAVWPVSFKVNSLKLAQSVLEHGEFKDLDYRVFGNFKLSESANLPSIPFDKRGNVGSKKN